ncbi:MAG: hypothetical protein K0S39_696 [Paenibacillus sp.]|jgi:hypothetical protein|nr:hypothetical protein [Paenibacillus sp.]
MSKAEEILFQVEVLTNSMVQGLESASYNDLVQFVDERDRLINELQEEPVSFNPDEYRARVLYILEQDKLLGAKMLTFKQEAQKSIEKFQRAEKYKQAYDKEYTMDSIFFNKTK